MKEQEKLTRQMSIFAFVIIVLFASIVLTEKVNPLFTSRIQDKMIKYVTDKYPDEVINLDIDKPTYKNTIYTSKITSKSNKDLYFTINYSNKKMSDTYKTDYLEGKTLLTTLTKKLEKSLKDEYKTNFKVTILDTLNHFSDNTRKEIINKNSFKDIPIYNIEIELEVEFDQKAILNKITDIHSKLNIKPKSYTIYINSTKSFRIYNLDDEIIENSNLLNNIISDIINKKEDSSILKDNNITYKYD